VSSRRHCCGRSAEATCSGVCWAVLVTDDEWQVIAIVGSVTTATLGLLVGAAPMLLRTRRRAMLRNRLKEALQLRSELPRDDRLVFPLHLVLDLVVIWSAGVSQISRRADRTTKFETMSTRVGFERRRWLQGSWVFWGTFT